MGNPPECRVIRPGAGYEGKQGVGYGAGVSAESAGSTGLCLHSLVIPPGGRGQAHLHEHHESAIHVVSGEGEMWWGDGLAHHEVVRAGDFVYIPAGVPAPPGQPQQDRAADRGGGAHRSQRAGERVPAPRARRRGAAGQPSAISRQLTASSSTTGVITSRSGRLREMAFSAIPRAK
jgi:uncharacterized RmlC-like cupin family protein